MKKGINIIGILIIISALFLSIGYAALSDNMTITNTVAYVRADANVRIMDVVVTNGAASVSNLNYNTKSILNTVSIPANGSVTYAVTVRNLGNVPLAISGATFTSGGNTINSLSSSITNANYEKICNNNVCTITAVKAITLTITNNGDAINNTNLDVNLIFTPYYTITYNNEIVGDALQGGTFTYTVANNITSVSKVSGTGTLDTSNLPNISISGIGSAIVLTGTTGQVGDGTANNPYINISQTYDPTNVQDGYTRFDEAPGKPLITASTTTINGEDVTRITSFNYTNTGTTGVPFGTNANSTLDTGVIAINGQRFSIHIKFKTNVSLSDNKNKFVLTVLEQVSNTTYSGFSINILNSSTPHLQVSGHNQKTYTGSTLNAGQSLKLNSSADATSNTENIYEITLLYNPNAGQPFTASCTGSNCYTTSTQTMNKKNIPSSLNNATIKIGGNGINNTNDIGSMSVLELHICKGTFGTNYSCTAA